MVTFCSIACAMRVHRTRGCAVVSCAPGCHFLCAECCIVDEVTGNKVSVKSKEDKVIWKRWSGVGFMDFRSVSPLNGDAPFRRPPGLCLGGADVRGQTRSGSGEGVCVLDRVWSPGCKVLRQLQCSQFQSSPSAPLRAVCPAGQSGETGGLRGRFGRATGKALPLRYSPACRAQRSGRRQRGRRSYESTSSATARVGPMVEGI